MKQKITIMKQRLDLSDEEINSYMDFDSLRKKQTEFETIKRNRYTILKWAVPTLLLISSVIWFFSTNDTGAKMSSTDQRLETELNQTNQSAQPLTFGVDSVKLENEVDRNNGDSSNGVLKERPVKSDRQEKPAQETVRSADNTQVESVYIQAEPIDGYASLYDYLNSNLRYPTESIKDSIQGVQTVSFTINIEGRPEKIQFGESLGSPFEMEAKRLIENMPAWKPATLNGNPVSSKLTLPITFQIKKIKVKE